MTIGYILDDSLDRSDGVQQAVLTIGEYMRELGHDVHYIVADTKREDIKNIHSVGSYYSFKFNGNSVRTPKPASRRKIRTLFNEVEFDVLHVQMPYSPFLAARVLRMAPTNIKKIGTFHILPYSFLSTIGTRLLGLVLRRSLHSLDICYAVSEPARAYMESTFKVNGVVVPNPIDYDFFRSAKPFINEKKQVVYVGRFEERKGVRELIEAYALLDSRLRKKCELIMISKGPLFDEMRQLARKRHIRVIFPGFISEEEKARYLSSATVAVFPSISGESFGIVLAEAMAAGSAITIGGNNPGYTSILDRWPETLFNPKDTKGFAQKLTEILENDQIVERIGAEQHKSAKKYDIELVAQKLLKSYLQ